MTPNILVHHIGSGHAQKVTGRVREGNDACKLVLVGFALIGVIDVRRHVAQSAQIGYWLGEEHSGKGFARAAVRATTKFCFENLGLHRVEAAVQPDNERSIRLLEAIGFQHEGRARGALKINGVWQDHEIYALLSSDG